MLTKKLIDIGELTVKLASKRSSVKISACSGSFDILHSGHISYLLEAKAQGDILVVFLNSDESIKLYKGSSRPVLKLEDRIELLGALSCIDYIVTFDELNPINLIKTLRPDVFCNGIDWGENPVEKSIVEAYGGKFKIISPNTRDKISTSEIIFRAHEAYKAKSKKVIMLDRDGVLIVDKGYVSDPNDVEITKETIAGLEMLRDAGYTFFVITNQSGIGRKMFREEDMHAVHNKIDDILSNYNLNITKYFYCPHTPEESCSCRKPKTKLLERAAIEYDIALGQAWMIGDKKTDIEAGRRANMKTVFIGEKYVSTDSLTEPTLTADNLDTASKSILGL